jgi:hypothetical protein
MIRVDAVLKKADAMLQKLETTKEQINLAKRAAVNATIKGMRLDAGRSIRATIQVSKVETSNTTPKKVVESRIKLFFAKGKSASEEISSGKILIKESKIPIKWFNPKQIPKVTKAVTGQKRKSKGRKKSVTTAKVMKGGSRGIYPKGFGPNVQKLGFTIWQRKGSARFPIKTAEGVDVAEIIRKTGAEKQLRVLADQRLRKNLKRRIDRIKFVKPRQKK